MDDMHRVTTFISSDFRKVKAERQILHCFKIDQWSILRYVPCTTYVLRIMDPMNCIDPCAYSQAALRTALAARTKTDRYCVCRIV